MRRFRNGEMFYGMGLLASRSTLLVAFYDKREIMWTYSTTSSQGDEIMFNGLKKMIIQ